jgi:hypothetical protein
LVDLEKEMKFVIPNCGQVGFSYTKSVKKSAKNIYFYLRFRHYDRTLKDHDIDQKVRVKKPKHVTEYNRKLKEATAFSFKPYFKRYDNLNCSPIKNSDINTALPIVVYDFENIIPQQVNNESKKLNDLDLKVSKQEIDWLLRQKQVKGQANVRKYYKNLLKTETKRLVMIGENAVKEGYRIASLESFTGNGRIINGSDRYGMLVKILKMREKREKLSYSCDDTYNKPPRTLQIA